MKTAIKTDTDTGVHVQLPDGTEYEFTKAKRDENGNRRYYVSWMALGLKEYASTPATRRAGLIKIKTKAYGGGFVFQCSTGNVIRAAEFFHSLGLHRPIEKIDIGTERAKLDTAIREALASEIGAIGPMYILDSLATALRIKAAKSVANKSEYERLRLQAKRINELSNTI